MDLRALLKGLVPPVIVRAVRNHQNGLVSGPIWRGVYPRYRDVPARSEGYRGAELAKRTFALTANVARAAQSEEGRLLPKTPSGPHGFLGLAAALVSRESARVRVLDFGGGMGIGFLHLLGSLRSDIAIQYDVVETPVMCDGGRRLFDGDRRIRFRQALPGNGEIEGPDIVYVSSALQYVEDYRTLLGGLCGYGAPLILFTHLSAGHVPTYATAQRNLRGIRLPYWFLNVSELVEIMHAWGYEIVFASLGERLDDRSNFPVPCRVTHPCNLLFSRARAAGA